MATRKSLTLTSRTTFRCVEQLRPGVEKFHEGAAVSQGEVDGDPWRERTVRADIGFGVENHNDGRTIVEMGIEVPPFIAAPFRADALTVLELSYFSGGDAKSFVVGGTIRQPTVAVLAAMHELLDCQNGQRIRSWALRNVSIHFFRPIRSSFESGGSRTWRQPSRPTMLGSESVAPSFEL